MLDSKHDAGVGPTTVVDFTDPDEDVVIPQGQVGISTRSGALGNRSVGLGEDRSGGPRSSSSEAPSPPPSIVGQVVVFRVARYFGKDRVA